MPPGEEESIGRHHDRKSFDRAISPMREIQRLAEKSVSPESGMTGTKRLLRLWRLANVSEARVPGETFERDPAFDLQRYAGRSFGMFQEKPVKVVLRFDARAARDAFHPDHPFEENEDFRLQTVVVLESEFPTESIPVKNMDWHRGESRRHATVTIESAEGIESVPDVRIRSVHREEPIDWSLAMSTDRPAREERIELRATREEMRLLAAAAECERLDMTSFIMRNVLPVARESAGKAERIALSRRDTERVLELLENPPEPTPALLAAARRRTARI